MALLPHPARRFHSGGAKIGSTSWSSDVCSSDLDNKTPSAPSVFQPAALLREARRQKGLPAVNVPEVCILDPDGDIVRQLRQAGETSAFEAWPCYHTRLDAFTLAGQRSEARRGVQTCALPILTTRLRPRLRFASRLHCCVRRGGKKGCPPSMCRRCASSTRTATLSGSYGKPARRAHLKHGPATTPGSTLSLWRGKDRKHVVEFRRVLFRS